MRKTRKKERTIQLQRKKKEKKDGEEEEEGDCGANREEREMMREGEKEVKERKWSERK